MSKPLLLFIDFGEVVIWRMGPGPTWVGPAPRCGHPTGRAFAPTSTGRRPGRTNAFADRLNCIFEVTAMVTALLKNKESEAAGAGTSFLGQLRRWVRPAGP